MKLIEENTTGKLWSYENGLVNSNSFIFTLKTSPNTFYVIDPGSESKEIYKTANLPEDAKYVVLLTHGHFDHVIGVNEFDSETTTIYMHPLEEKHLSRNNFYLKALKLPFEVPIFTWRPIEEFEEQQSSVRVLRCPGHTSGSLMFQVDDWIFTGDSVLSRSLIAPTVRGSDSQIQLESVKTILDGVCRKTLILPGHGKPMRLDEMLKVNLELFHLIEAGN